MQGRTASPVDVFSGSQKFKRLMTVETGDGGGGREHGTTGPRDDGTGHNLGKDSGNVISIALPDFLPPTSCR